eukprot:gene1564-1709_t
MSDNDLNTQLQRVLLMHKSGQVEEAIEGYNRLIPKMPQQIQLSLLGNLGALYMARGQYEEAKESFLSAVTIAPGNSQAQFNLAVLLTSKLNDHAKALKHSALAIRADASSYKAFHLMGNILQNLGKHKEAEKYFEQAELLAQEEQNTSSREVNSEDHSQTSLGGLISIPLKAGESVEVEAEGEHYIVRCASEQPMILVVDDFLTETECQHIRQTAIKQSMEKSFIMGSDVVDTRSMYNTKSASKQEANEAVGKEEDKESHSLQQDMIEDPRLYRSSYTAWLPRDDILEKFQRKLSQLLGLPLPYIQHKSEDLQVVKYRLGGQFKAHSDSSAYHPRLLTALVYLNTVDEVEGAVGGETWFPFAGKNASNPPPKTVEEAVVQSLEIYESSSVKDLPGVRVKPQRGRIVIFFNYDLSSGVLDPLAVHSGLPVRREDNSQSVALDNAEKWIGNYWIENDPKLLADLLTRQT